MRHFFIGSASRKSPFFVSCLAACALSSLAACSGADSMEKESTEASSEALTLGDGDALYSNIKLQEQALNPHNNVGNVTVGTYDAASRSWSGLTTEPDDLWFDDAHKPHHTNLGSKPVQVAFHAIDANLIFNGSNCGGRFSVTAAGKTATSTGTWISINVGLYQGTIDWTLTCGASTYGDKFVLVRDLVLGAGAFTVDVLPVAVIYDAPPGARNTNAATYAVGSQSGTTVTITDLSSNGKTVPSTAMYGNDSFDFLASKAVPALKAAAVTAPVGIILDTFIKGLGSSSANTTTTSQYATSTSMNVSISETMSTTPTSHLGPGNGDIIEYISNAHLAWMATPGGRVYLKMFGHRLKQMYVSDLVADLRAIEASPDAKCTPGQILCLGPLQSKAVGPNSGLRYAKVFELLQLDPLAPNGIGLDAAVRSGRFKLTNEFTPAGLNVLKTVVTTDTITSTATTKILSTMDQVSPGFLSAMGLGSPGMSQQQQVNTTLSNSSTWAHDLKTTVESDLTVNAYPGEHPDLQAYYDTVFGTVAWVQKAGTVSTPSGGPKTPGTGDGPPILPPRGPEL